MSLRTHKSQLRKIACTLTASVLIQTAVASLEPDSQSSQRAISLQLNTLRTLDRPLTFDLYEERLEDVIQFLEQLANCPIIVHWDDGTMPDGLDRQTPISLRASNDSLRVVLDRVLEQADAQSRPDDASTWQLTKNGRLEIGPRSRLNRHKRIEVYYIGDLTSSTPDFPQGATIDLQSALAPSQGASTRAPLTDSITKISAPTPETSANEQLIETIVQTIEPDQWNRHGGDGARVHTYGDWLIINAPGYIHRQLVGIQP